MAVSLQLLCRSRRVFLPIAMTRERSIRSRRRSTWRRMTVAAQPVNSTNGKMTALEGWCRARAGAEQLYGWWRRTPWIDDEH